MDATEKQDELAALGRRRCRKKSGALRLRVAGDVARAIADDELARLVRGK